MRSKPFLKFVFVFFTFLFSTILIAQESPATIPDSFFGTYELTYGDFSNGAVTAFSDGEVVTFVIQSGGVLCINGTEVSNPVFKNGNMVEAFWTDADGLEYGFSNISSENFNEANLFEDGSFAGQFTGTRISDETSCVGGSEEVSLSTDAQGVLDLAEELFGNFFSNGSALGTVQGYIYRYYPSSGAYIGFKDGNVFTFGGPFGKTLKNFGAVSQVNISLQNQKAKIELDADDIETGDLDITGEFDLTISGDISTIVAGIAAPPVAFEVTINDIVAPDPSDTDEVTNIITETLEGVSGISELEIVVTNNTESRITFSVAFSAVQNGVTVSMDLEYDYVR